MISNPPSIFSSVQPGKSDSILGLNAEFRADPSPRKVNLGVGAYRTDEGAPYVLPVVRRVEQQLANDEASNHEYLPQEGLSPFTSLSARLILGNDSPAITEDRAVTVQSVSGTGALRIGFDFISIHLGERPVYFPNPTWPNHYNVVNAAKLPSRLYTYFDEETGGVNISQMLQDLKQAPKGSVVVLHACAHNPTGADPSRDDWRAILDVVCQGGLIPFFDTAYQGFASGDLDDDAFAIRLFDKAGIDMFIAQSYAKNLGLYGERVGTLTIISSSPDPIKDIRVQLQLIIRATYSSPPLHGAQIVKAILSDPNLFDEWKQELTNMSNRITKMRRLLHDALVSNGTPGSWEHITSQIGMFSYTRLSKEQVHFLREQRHIYMTADGRMSMAGLTEDTISYVADAMRDAIKDAPSH